ncbi:MAG: hypothetical protein FWG94_07065 [Oscillospiraceae bacterium]|nr:hypothetical protein [Oscillospiraceae bacterium]
MAGYSGISMSNNAVEAYAEGRKPVSSITKEDIQKHGINEGITFFRWYVKNCCRSDEWHHSSPKYNQTTFYNIEECCNQFKKADIEKLKTKYKSQSKPKTDAMKDNKPYYAWVEYSISTFSGRRKYLEAYAIVFNCWAYIKDDYKKGIVKKRIDGKHFHIAKKYEARPEEMPEDEANAILEKMKIS